MILVTMAWAVCPPGHAQQFSAVAIEQPDRQVAALAERVAAQFREASSKKPFLMDLTLPDEEPCPLGAWLADRLSESLERTHPELEVVPRSWWRWSPPRGEVVHDQNQELAQKEQYARTIGAEFLVRGNFAAVPGGIGITLVGSDRFNGGNSRFEVLAEIPITPEMQRVLAAGASSSAGGRRRCGELPERSVFEGAFPAGMAGIGAPLCEFCPAPEYNYVAKARKLQGVVITEIRVGPDGAVESGKIIRTPNPALGTVALRTVRDWRFMPAHNSRGDAVAVVVNVAVSFKLEKAGAAAASAMNKKF